MGQVKDTAKRQYARMLDQAASQLTGLKSPPQGWISAMRKALGMSAPALARRAGVTKSAIYQAQRAEAEGRITLHQMDKLAQALGGRFVCAIVPDETIEATMRVQAHTKAENIIHRAGTHMALEKQALSPAQVRIEIDRMTDDLMHAPPADFWGEQ